MKMSKKIFINEWEERAVSAQTIVEREGLTALLAKNRAMANKSPIPRETVPLQKPRPVYRYIVLLALVVVCVYFVWVGQP